MTGLDQNEALSGRAFRAIPSGFQAGAQALLSERRPGRRCSASVGRFPHPDDGCCGL